MSAIAALGGRGLQLARGLYNSPGAGAPAQVSVASLSPDTPPQASTGQTPGMNAPAGQMPDMSSPMGGPPPPQPPPMSAGSSMPPAPMAPPSGAMPPGAPPINPQAMGQALNPGMGGMNPMQQRWQRPPVNNMGMMPRSGLFGLS